MQGLCADFRAEQGFGECQNYRIPQPPQQVGNTRLIGQDKQQKIGEQESETDPGQGSPLELAAKGHSCWSMSDSKDRRMGAVKVNHSIPLLLNFRFLAAD
jgi:hypothetical protein